MEWFKGGKTRTDTNRPSGTDRQTNSDCTCLNGLVNTDFLEKPFVNKRFCFRVVTKM